MKELSLLEIQQTAFDILCEFDAFCREHDIRYFLSNGTLLGAIKYKGFIPWDDDIDVLVPRSDYDRLIRIFPTEGKLQLLCDERGESYVLPFAKLSDPTTLITNQTTLKNEYGVHIDIFPLDGWHNDIHIAKKQACEIKKFCRKFGMSIVPLSKGRTFLRTCVKNIWIAWAHLIGHKHFHAQLEKKIERSLNEAGESTCGCVVWPMYGEREIIPADVFSSTIQVEFQGNTFPAPRGYDRYLRSLYGDYEKDPPPDKQRSHHNFKAYRVL